MAFSWSYLDVTASSSFINDESINELYSKISTLRQRYGLTAITGSHVAGQIVLTSYINNLRTYFDAMSGLTPTTACTTHYSSRLDTHNSTFRSTHYVTHQGAHYVSHLGTHNSSFQTSHCSTYRATHYVTHQGAHRVTYYATRYTTHLNDHNASYLNANRGTHYLTYNSGFNSTNNQSGWYGCGSEN